MISGVYWSVGSRAVNEDSVALETVRTDRGVCALAAVCDGIGSLSRGETASGYVTECMVRWFYRVGVRMNASTRWRIRRSLRKCIYDAHTELARTAQGADIRWGTTCTCVCIWGHRYVCVHVGDSAAYRIGREQACCLRGLLHSGGRSAPRKLRRLTARHVSADGRLTRCVGSMGYYAPDITFGRLGRREGVIVMSDGYAEGISESELADSLDLRGVLTDERLDRRLAGVGAEIARRGGSDNRSAVCVMV